MDVFQGQAPEQQEDENMEAVQALEYEERQALEHQAAQALEHEALPALEHQPDYQVAIPQGQSREGPPQPAVEFPPSSSADSDERRQPDHPLVWREDQPVATLADMAPPPTPPAPTSKRKHLSRSSSEQSIVPKLLALAKEQADSRSDASQSDSSRMSDEEMSRLTGRHRQLQRLWQEAKDRRDQEARQAQAIAEAQAFAREQRQRELTEERKQEIKLDVYLDRLQATSAARDEAVQSVRRGVHALEQDQPISQEEHLRRICELEEQLLLPPPESAIAPHLGTPIGSRSGSDEEDAREQRRRALWAQQDALDWPQYEEAELAWRLQLLKGVRTSTKTAAAPASEPQRGQVGPASSESSSDDPRLGQRAKSTGDLPDPDKSGSVPARGCQSAP